MSGMWPHERRQPTRTTPALLTQTNRGLAMFHKFDEWEARRVIRRYNLLRRKTGLPPISVEEEIDRMRDALNRAKAEFEQFIYRSALRHRVSEKVLNRIRRQRSNPSWRPSGVLSGGGLGFELDVNRHMEKLWSRRQRRL